MRGAPVIQDFLETTLREWVALARSVVRRWIAEGKLRPIEPQYLFYHDLGDDAALRQCGA